MPAQVVGVGYSDGASTTYNYVYNAEHERSKLVHGTLGTFIYLHPAGKGQLLYEKQIEASPSTRIEHKYYISAGGTSVAVHYARENPNLTETTTATRYLHQDHLGSITLITNEAGGVTERLAYEAYGKRRYPAGTDDPTNGLFGQVTDRGFTSHEHLDEIALIHMNGRVYDPVLGRFVTADPFLQDPGNLQSYNRYSYVLNNPLMYVDPSGYFSLKKVFKVVAVVAVAYVTAGAASAAFSSYTAAAGGTSIFGVSTLTAANTVGFAASSFGTIAAGAVGGFSAGLLASGGDLKTALVSGVTGGAFAGIGAEFGDTWNLQRVGSQAFVGGASSKLQGGDFKSGFLSVGTSATLRYLYNEVVNYDVTFESGGDAVEKSLNEMPKRFANNIGRQGDKLNPSGWFNEGGIVSRILNKIPGVNAVAGLHDVFQVNLNGYSRDILNVPGMLPATVITAGALLDGVPGEVIRIDRIAQQRRGK